MRELDLVSKDRQFESNRNSVRFRRLEIYELTDVLEEIAMCIDTMGSCKCKVGNGNANL